MKTKVRKVLPGCDLCGAKDLEDVWDRPVHTGQWAFCCISCHSDQQKTLLGTHLTNRKPWSIKYPVYARLMESIDVIYADKDVIDRAYAMYGEDGLFGQIPYVECTELTIMESRRKLE